MFVIIIALKLKKKRKGYTAFVHAVVTLTRAYYKDIKQTEETEPKTIKIEDPMTNSQVILEILTLDDEEFVKVIKSIVDEYKVNRQRTSSIELPAQRQSMMVLGLTDEQRAALKSQTQTVHRRLPPPPPGASTPSTPLAPKPEAAPVRQPKEAAVAKPTPHVRPVTMQPTATTTAHDVKTTVPAPARNSVVAPGRDNKTVVDTAGRAAPPPPAGRTAVSAPKGNGPPPPGRGTTTSAQNISISASPSRPSPSPAADPEVSKRISCIVATPVSQMPGPRRNTPAPPPPSDGVVVASAKNVQRVSAKDVKK